MNKLLYQFSSFFFMINIFNWLVLYFPLLGKNKSIFDRETTKQQTEIGDKSKLNWHCKILHGCHPLPHSPLPPPPPDKICILMSYNWFFWQVKVEMPGVRIFFLCSFFFLNWRWEKKKLDKEMHLQNFTSTRQCFDLLKCWQAFCPSFFYIVSKRSSKTKGECHCRDLL